MNQKSNITGENKESSLPEEGFREGLISITAIASISPLGISLKETWDNYKGDHHMLSEGKFGETTVWAGFLSEEGVKEIEELKASDSKYQDLDNSVLYAIYASRKALAQAGWKATDDFGINIGSSRGATALFEKYHQEFLEHNRTGTLSSPTTTLGNIASWVAHDLQTKGPEISHSITCSTALHSLLNGVAWIKSGMANQFLVGGSEAPLTPFTVAQMKALKIYASTSVSTSSQAKSKPECHSELVEEQANEPLVNAQDKLLQSYPCQALNLEKTKNTMVLGEGASIACLEKGVHENSLAVISGVGYATEILKHNISISSDAQCFQRSMKMALGDLNPDAVDVIVTHTPGTIKGDSSEMKAIEKVFCNKKPLVTTNKWKIGHTFGTSGMLSIELAILMLQHQKFIFVPFLKNNVAYNQEIKTILVNAVGFGGNAVSILLTR